jgi:regulator of RNase E activity RraA
MRLFLTRAAKDPCRLQQRGVVAFLVRRYSASPSAGSVDKNMTVEDTSNDLLDRLRQVDTTVLCDADKALHGPLQQQQLSGHHLKQEQQDRISLIRLRSIPTKQTSVMVGVARTVLLSPQHDDDFLGVVQGLLEAKPGEVLVVSSSGHTNSKHNKDDDSSRRRRAVAGDLLCSEAVRMGLKGMVVDGCMRDVAHLARVDNFRCYASSITRMQELHNTRPKNCNAMFSVVVPWFDLMMSLWAMMMDSWLDRVVPSKGTLLKRLSTTMYAGVYNSQYMDFLFNGTSIQNDMLHHFSKVNQRSYIDY